MAGVIMTNQKLPEFPHIFDYKKLRKIGYVIISILIGMCILLLIKMGYSILPPHP